MLNNFVNKIVFLEAFLSKNYFFRFPIKINNKEKTLLQIDSLKLKNFQKKIFLLQDVPNYLNINIHKEKNSLKSSSISTQKGYLIDLTLFQTMKEYLNTTFVPKSRSSMRRYQSRLEKCFNISYTAYYGSIQKEEYDRLFIVLESLMIRRFDEKKEFNYELDHLSQFQESLYDLVLEKKACLFVIYDGNKPISIRINMLKDTLAFYILSCYDIDYSKFHLGIIDMLKNIEWCFKNHFEKYDLLKGYYYYKKKWITNSYQCNNVLIYDSKSLITAILANCKILKETTLYSSYKISKRLRFDVPYKKLKKKLFTKSKDYGLPKYVLKDVETKLNLGDTLKEIHVENDDEYAVLRKPLYDFLYTNKEFKEETTVYMISKDSGKFLLKGKNNEEWLRVEP